MRKSSIYISRILLAAGMTFALTLICPMQAQDKKSQQSYLKERKKEVTDSIRLVEKGLKVERDSADRIPTIKKDSLVEIQHALRVGIDLFTPLLPILGDNDDKAWQIKADYRFAPKWYAAVDFGYQNRSKDFTMQMTSSDGYFIRAGLNYSILRNMFSSDDMMYIGMKIGYSKYDRHIWGDTLRSSHWDREEIVDIHDTPSALWGDLSLGVMVQVAKNVYLSMDAAYDMILSAKKPNGTGPLMVSGVGQVYNNSTGFSFSYTVSYRIPLYKKTHRMRIKERPASDNEKSTRDIKKEEKFTPSFHASELVEE